MSRSSVVDVAVVVGATVATVAVTFTAGFAMAKLVGESGGRRSRAFTEDEGPSARGQLRHGGDDDFVDPDSPQPAVEAEQRAAAPSLVDDEGRRLSFARKAVTSTVKAAQELGGADLGSAGVATGAGAAGVLAGEDLRDLARSYSQRRRTGPYIIGVAGASGSGKTTIARAVQERMTNCTVCSISSDSYYKTMPKGTKPSTYNFDHPDAVDFDLLVRHLQDLKAGRPVHVPEYDFSIHCRTDKTSLIERADVVIVDGIFTLWHKELRDTCDLTIFTMEDLDTCLIRRLKRDIQERGRSVDSVLEQYEKFVKPGYMAFIGPSKSFANLVIPRARDNHEATDMIARDVQMLVQCNLSVTQGLSVLESPLLSAAPSGAAAKAAMPAFSLSGSANGAAGGGATATAAGADVTAADEE